MIPGYLRFRKYMRNEIARETTNIKLARIQEILNYPGPVRTFTGKTLPKQTPESTDEILFCANY